MPLVLADRVNETTTTTSTGTLTLAGAVSGYQSFAVIGNGNTTYYTIVHQTANEWEVGIGTYTSSGTLLSRDTVLASSNSGSLVNFSAGTKFVFCDYPAGRAVYLDTATNVTIPGLTLSGGTANGVLYLNGSKVATSGSGLTFNGTTLVSPDITDSSLTSGRVTYAGTGGNFVDSANLTFNGTTLVAADFTDSSLTSGRVVFSGAGGNLSDSSSLTWNGTGLGVGTSSAGVQLDVRSSIGSTPGFNNNVARFLSTATAAVGVGGAIVLGGKTNNLTADYAFAGLQGVKESATASNYAGSLLFLTQNSVGSTSLSEHMRLLSTGDFGIGTAAPNYKLDVRGTIATGNGTVRMALSSTAADGITGTLSNHGLFFYTNNTARGYFDTSGSLGLGTTTSRGDLDVSSGATTTAITKSVHLGYSSANFYGFRLANTNTAGSFFAGTFSIQRGTGAAWSDDFAVNNSGNVGIGTTNPTNTAGFSRQVQIEGTTAALTLSGTTGTGKYSLGVPGANAVGLWDNTASAYRWYVDSSGNLGIGTASPAVKLDVVGSATSAPIQTSVSNTSTTGQYPSASYLIKTYNGSSVATVGSVGGTSSTFGYQQIAANQMQMHSFRSGGMRFAAASSGPITWATGSNTDPDFIEEKMRLDSSGNLGLGVTPSAWSGVGGVLEIKGNAYIYSATGVLSSGANAFFNGTNWIYKTTQAATRYEQVNGLHQWSNAASGTAGNAISFTQAMTLDASGNLGIGTASPGYKLSVAGASGSAVLNLLETGVRSWGVRAGGTATNTFDIADFTAGATRLTIDSSGNLGIGTASPAVKLQVAGAIRSNSSVTGPLANLHTSATNPASTGASGNGLNLGYDSNSENSWIQANRNGISETRSLLLNPNGGGVGISEGNTPTQILSLYRAGSTNALMSAGNSNTGLDGTWFGVDTTGNGIVNVRGAFPLIFSTSALERARITSAGKMLVGTTTASGTLTVDGIDAISTGGASTYAITCGNDAADALAFGSDASFAYVQSFASRPLILNLQGNEVRVAGTTDQGAYNLQCNGTGVWGAGAYVNGSDARLKDNIQSLDSGLDVVKAIRPVTFQYKPEYSKDQSVQPGFIAQELQAAMAGKAYLEGVVQSGPEHLNVAYQNIIPILVKAIQELSAKVTALEST